MSVKIIFLDIDQDGVLNNEHSKSRCCGFVGIDNDKVKRLKRIVDTTGAKIVLCSSWKEDWEPVDKDCQPEMGNYIDRKLKREGLRIIDKTMDLYLNRGEGIINWANSHAVKDFVILDDETFDYAAHGLIPRHVETCFDSENGGLQDEHVEKAIQILNR